MAFQEIKSEPWEDAYDRLPTELTNNSAPEVESLVEIKAAIEKSCNPDNKDRFREQYEALEAGGQLSEVETFLATIDNSLPAQKLTGTYQFEEQSRSTWTVTDPKGDEHKINMLRFEAEMQQLGLSPDQIEKVIEKMDEGEIEFKLEFSTGDESPLDETPKAAINLGTPRCGP